MIEYVKKILLGQYEAGLSMLNECMEVCAPSQWEGIIGKYPFWQVAYHVLCFTDYYLSPHEGAFELRAIHPKGMDELNEEYPSRRFEKTELIEYAWFCREKAGASIARETQESLEGPSGFARRTFSRGELHIYNIRHIQHHTGQLSAYLRRIEDVNQDPQTLRWVGTGWM